MDTSHTPHADTVAVPRSIALQAVHTLEQYDGVGPIVAARMRPYTATVDLTIDQRATLLERLAQQRNARVLSDQTVLQCLDYWAPGLDHMTREHLFDDYRATIAHRDGLDARSVDYRYATEFTGLDAEDRALQDAAARADDALRPLLYPQPAPVTAAREDVIA